MSNREPTPAEKYEWMLSGLLPETAIQTLEYDIQRIEKRIAREQIRLAHAHKALTRAKSDNFPKDESGVITLAPNNPLAL